MNKKTARLIEYNVIALFAAGLALLALRIRGYSGSAPLVERYRMLCDAFTIPGMLLTLLYLLIVCSKHGALDGVGYGLKRLFTLLVPFSGYKMETYADYLESKEEKKAKPAPHTMLHVGLAFLAIAIVFLLLFNSVYEGSGVTA